MKMIGEFQFIGKAMDYHEFLKNKQYKAESFGFEPNYFPEIAFDYQRFIIEKAITRGREAIFADTGLGKTLIQISLANNIIRETNSKVLILTPLAVAFQFIKEAHKLGIDDIEYSKDGQHSKKIVVCNYERLHYFDPKEFVGAIADECFAPDTKIQVIRGKKLLDIYIKDCKIGDNVLNCVGLDKITAIKKRKIPYAIKLHYNAREIICSPKHPFFTQRGWVPAKEIQKDDFIISTDKAMRILQERFSDNLQVRPSEKVLREVLLSEMENEAARSFSEGSQSSSSEKKRHSESVLVEKYGSGAQGNRENKKIKPDGKFRSEEKNIINSSENEPQTFSAWGKWSRDDIAAAIAQGCYVRELDSGICYIFGKNGKGLPVELQSRLSRLNEKNCDRSGWQLSLCEKASGQKEGRETGYFRVEGFEVLESTNNRLDQYREADGSLYFYDLEIEQHPSFTINECLVHNSSILKSFDGKIKKNVTNFMKLMRFRFLSTATPSPNDFIELGTSSEALGYLPYMDMLDRFFANNENNIRPQDIGNKWYLKPHAKDDFFSWVRTWSTFVKKPSDLGFSDKGYELPNLIENKVFVEGSTTAQEGQLDLFLREARTMGEVREDQKETIQTRCEKAVEIANNHETSVYWCNFNAEGDLLQELDKNAVQLSGGMDLDKKEEILLNFADGKIKKLITKAKITAFGLNWQHCNHTTYFPTFSYEQYYQAIRRFWRFGQKREVLVDLILSESQKRVIDALLLKTQKAKELHQNITNAVNRQVEFSKKQFKDNISKPLFLTQNQ